MSLAVHPYNGVNKTTTAFIASWLTNIGIIPIIEGNSSLETTRTKLD